MPLDEPAWWYRKGPSATAALLQPLASIYGWAATRRFALAQAYRSRLPVICVGNFTAGGTGKTPLVAHLCAHLARAGQRPVVITRGYGGRHAGPHWVARSDTAADVGDEALLLARVAPTLVARDRGAGARAAETREEAASAIVMDDGMQNPQLAKDLTIAVVDGTRGLGNCRVIPAGPLRAPLEFQLRLVDAIVVNAASAEAGEALAQSLKRLFSGPVLRAITVVAGDASWLKGLRVVAWAGIGAPQRFFRLLEAQGAQLAETVTFRDHQAITAADAERLLLLARLHQAQLVGTEKDLARIAGQATGPLAELTAATRPLPIALTFPELDAARLGALIDDALARRSR